LYLSRKDRGSFCASSRVSGFSKEKLGVEAKKVLASVVLPDCRGPVIVITGYPGINERSTFSTDRGIIPKLFYGREQLLVDFQPRDQPDLRIVNRTGQRSPSLWRKTAYCILCDP
jgi:hypothetical protein